jgi:hypothetical protein
MLASVLLVELSNGRLLEDGKTLDNSIMMTRLERAIQNYLAAHPFAADSATGIQRWWLPEDLACASVAVLDAALANLVAHGVLREEHLPDGNLMFASAVKPPKPIKN